MKNPFQREDKPSDFGMLGVESGRETQMKWVWSVHPFPCSGRAQQREAIFSYDWHCITRYVWSTDNRRGAQSPPSTSTTAPFAAGSSQAPGKQTWKNGLNPEKFTKQEMGGLLAYFAHLVPLKEQYLQSAILSWKLLLLEDILKKFMGRKIIMGR